MEQHPLHYFINLIEGRKLDDLRNSFFFVNPEIQVTAVNALEEYIEFNDVDDMSQQWIIDRQYFKHFLAKFLLEKKVEVIGIIDFYLLKNQDTVTCSRFIGNIDVIINELISQGKQYPDFIKYPVIEEILIDLKNSLNRKYSQNERVSPQIINPQTKGEKIVWNAGVASLCTLFYELCNDYKLTKKGISYLVASEDQLVKFIAENFVDADGEPFVIDSIKTYLSHRQDKKAKRDKVEINQIIPPSSITED
ncbi:hypothetical protein ECE50_021025 [Chitinophaga sp. Mgbs1]|uniref:Uncharacterized protein n=1 Tax=Chitinophaga solisilvae TaxID=1233460 RepID=A0A3S1CUC1_9BACT|nr:hypothetical protein [Chitinophaga solisilvae]